MTNANYIYQAKTSVESGSQALISTSCIRKALDFAFLVLLYSVHPVVIKYFGRVHRAVTSTSKAYVLIPNK